MAIKEPTEIIGNIIPRPNSVRMRFYKRLNKVITAMQKDIVRELNKMSKSSEAKAYTDVTQVFKENATTDAITFATLSDRTMNALYKKWTGVFNKLATPWVKDFVMANNVASKKAVVHTTKDMPFNSTIASQQIPEQLKISIQAMTKQTTDLIKSIPDQHISAIRGDIQRTITGQGTTFTQLRDKIAKSFINRNGQVQRRARNIVRDQTNKIYGNMTHTRLVNAGCEEFDWHHNGGSKEPRQLHRDVLNGKRFRYDNPPVIDNRTGERGLPAQAINCNCTGRPVYKLQS